MNTNRCLSNIARYLFGLASVSAIFVFALITYFLVVNGVPAMAEIGVKDFLMGMEWQPGAGIYGILPMIIGSVFVTLGAIVIGFPIGVMTAIFLSETAHPKMARLVRPVVQLLAGIPSVVYGFFGLSVLVPFILEIKAPGNSMLAAMIILGVMILPTVISVSENAIRAVPKEYKEGSYALGETKISTIFRITVPAAKSGILTSLVLAVGRAVGEATAVILVAGNTVQVPGSVFDSVRTLTANCVLEMGYASGLHKEALFATGVILFVIIILINVILSMINRKAGADR